MSFILPYGYSILKKGHSLMCFNGGGTEVEGSVTDEVRG